MKDAPRPRVWLKMYQRAKLVVAIKGTLAW